MKKWVQEKSVSALNVAASRKRDDSPSGVALQEQQERPQEPLEQPVQVAEPKQQQVTDGLVQEQLQVNVTKQQQKDERQQHGERNGCGTEGKKFQDQPRDTELVVFDLQLHSGMTKTPQQQLSEIRDNEGKVGGGVVEDKEREELLWSSAFAKDGAEGRQKGTDHERYHRREAELFDEEEDEDQEHQQLPSTVDSVASSTAGGYSTGGAARTIAQFERSSTDCGANGSISQFACAEIIHSISSTPLLTAGTAAETPPSVAAVSDAFMAPSLHLPLPAPLKKGLTDVKAVAGECGPAASVVDAEEGEAEDIAAAAGTEIVGRAAVEDAATAAKAEQKKAKEDNEAEQVGGVALEKTMGSGAPRGTSTAEAGVTGEDRAVKAAAAYGEAEMTGKKAQGGGEIAAGQGDARAKAAVGRERTAPHHSVWMQSRKKQSVAEQGRIAAAAVAAASHLFNRGEAGNSSHSVGDHPQQEVLIMSEQQQQLVDVPRGEKGRAFSLAVAGPTSHGSPHGHQQEQHEQQEEVDVQQAEEKRWLHPDAKEEEEAQQRQKRLQSLEAEEQEEKGEIQHEQQTRREVLQDGQCEKMQQENSHSLAIRLFAEELQEEGRKMLKAFCSEDEGEAAATEDSPTLLLPHDDMLFKSNSAEVGQQPPLQDNRLWDRSRSEGEQLKHLVLGKGLVNTSTASLYSLLQQQKEAPALLISAATLQHESSTKTSTVAPFSPRKPSPARGFLATAAASRDITVATIAAGEEATPLAREETGRVLGGGREGEESNTSSYLGLFQRGDAAKDSNDVVPPPMRATSGQDVMLSLMDLPCMLSLAAKAAPSLKEAGFSEEQQQPSVVCPSKPSTSAALAAQYAAAAALGGGGDAGVGSLHDHLREASAHQQQPFLHAEVAESIGGTAAPGACLSTELAAAVGAEGGEATTSPSSVRSLCLQAAMRPPPGFDVKAGDWPPQRAEQARHCMSDASGASTASATTASTFGSACTFKKPTIPADALLANATQESLAAAVAVLAAVVAAPTAAASTEATYRGRDVGATRTAVGRDPLFPVGDPFGAAAVAGTVAPADHVDGSSTVLSQEEGRNSSDGCRSGSPFDTASKHFLLAALTGEGSTAATAVGLSRAHRLDAAAPVGDAGSSAAVAAAAAARQAVAIAARVGEKKSAGERAAAGVAAGSFFSREATVGARGSNRTGFPSCQGGLRSLFAAESESGQSALFLAKQQQLLSLPKHRSSQKQPERRCMPRRGGSEAGGSLRLFDPAGEGRAAPEGRAVPEGRATMPEGRVAAAEGGRAAGCGASSLSSFGGRAVFKGASTGNNHSGSRHAWLRKGEYLEHQQLQHSNNSTRGAYGGRQGERNSRRGAAAAPREKLAQEPKKDGFKVFFGNASALTTEEEMYGLFRQFGECSELILLRDRRQRLRGAGFVTFRNAADAMRAIEGLDRKHTVLGGTKPLEVRIPENSEQKRERIRALARLRAENAQQQSQEQHQLEQQQQPQQQQQGNQQQQDYQQQQQQLGYSSQQYAQHRHSFSEQYSNVARHQQYTMTPQRQQFSHQRQQQYTTTQQQQAHVYYEQQLRGAATQRLQLPSTYYEQQHQRRGMSQQRVRGYAVGNECEKVKMENRPEILWQVADAHMHEAVQRSAGSTPEQEKSDTPTAAATVAHHPASALEALLAVAAAQHRQQQMQQDYKDRTAAENTAESTTQELLALMQGYARQDDDDIFSAFADQQQQKEQHPHQLQQDDDYSITKLAHSLYHAPGSAALCSSTLPASNPASHAPAGAAAAVGGESGEEHTFCRDTRSCASTHSQRRAPSVALNNALAAAFPSSPSAAADYMMLDRISCSSETTAGGSLWQGPCSGIDHKTVGNYLPPPSSARRCSRGGASPPEGNGDAYSSISSVTATDGAATTADAHARTKADSIACQERGFAYINAVANMLSNRDNCVPSRRLERDTVADSQPSCAAGGRYGASQGSYLQISSFDAASILQSATGDSPVASSSLAPSAAMERSSSVNGDVNDCRGAAAEALTNFEGLQFFPLQQADGSSMSPLDLLCGSGKLSESWIKRVTRLRETD